MARGLSWAAVGMGGHKMPGSLMFMIYPSASEKNVTFSPRLATDHTEPELYRSLDFETLSNATGLMNETTYVYSAVCHNCRSWRGGSLDVNSTSQQFIFATGPGGDEGSDSDQASVKLHYEHGAFTMDMRHATGPAGPAVLNVVTADDNEGSVLVGEPVEGMNDWVAVIHAVFMIGCFVGLMPLGVLILRLGGWVRWHGLNQGVAMIGVIVGLGLGIKAGTLYNRVRFILKEKREKFGALLTGWRDRPRTSTRLTRSSASSCSYSFWPSSRWASCTIECSRRPSSPPSSPQSTSGWAGQPSFWG